jgi:hypothetical protein
MKSLDITERSLLADRIQGSCSIPFIVSDCELNLDELSFYQAISQCYLSDKKGFNVRYDRIKSQYYIEVPEEVYLLKFPFFSHVRLRLDNPFTITAEFNFIRYIRHFAVYEECDNEGFPVSSGSYDREYDLSIRLADDNYIDSKVWKTYKSYLIKDIAFYIPDLFKQLSTHIINEYYTDFSRSYTVLTVKQIEFNHDYYVGSHKSSDVLHQLMYFIVSASGSEWIKKLSGLAVSVYKCDESVCPETRFYGDLYNPTLKFTIGKGIFFKIYCKTTDHIRFEITFTRQYIKRKYGKQGFDFVYEPLRHVAKSFFKKADFKNIIYSAIENSYSDNFSLYDNLCNFVYSYDPFLLSVADAVIYKRPVADFELIRYIKSNKNLRGLFVSVALNNSKVLVYDPVLASSLKRSHRKELLCSDDKRLFMHRLWRDLKSISPDSDVFLMNDLSGFKSRLKI